MKWRRRREKKRLAGPDFGVVSIDAKAKYVRDLQTTETSLTIAVYANSIAGAETYTDVGLAPGIQPPGPGNLNDFYQAYGDSWASSITWGAEFIATYVFYCRTDQERESLEQELKINWEGDVTDTMQLAVQSLRATGQVQSSYDCD